MHVLAYGALIGRIERTLYYPTLQRLLTPLGYRKIDLLLKKGKLLLF